MALKKIFFSMSFLVVSHPLLGMDLEAANGTLLERMKSILLMFKHYGGHTTNFADRIRCGYQGQLIPIVKSPKIFRSGFIIENAQPSKWFDLWYDHTHTPENIILVAQEDSDGKFDVHYRARIKPRVGSITKIWSSCLVADDSSDSMNCHLGVLWEESVNRFYISYATLAEIKKQDNLLNLDSNKVEVILKQEWAK